MGPKRTAPSLALEAAALAYARAWAALEAERAAVSADHAKATGSNSGAFTSASLPRIDSFTPIASFTAAPHTPSQLDECGAAISTNFGRSGNVPTMRQPPSRNTARPSPSTNRLRGIRGALGGNATTTSSCACAFNPNPVPCGPA